MVNKEKIIEEIKRYRWKYNALVNRVANLYNGEADSEVPPDLGEAVQRCGKSISWLHTRLHTSVESDQLMRRNIPYHVKTVAYFVESLENTVEGLEKENRGV